jgi:hypothetical protein
MKKILLKSIFILTLAILIISTQNSCKKDDPITTTVTKVDTVIKCPQNIQGLWVGTYTVGSGQPVPSGTSFYFAFSVYPDGTLSYKSKGFYNGSSNYITFADGTWNLNGSTFTFSVTTINLAGGGVQRTQLGTATYNITNGTLTNGTIADASSPSNTSIWSMSKVI